MIAEGEVEDQDLERQERRDDQVVLVIMGMLVLGVTGFCVGILWLALHLIARWV